MYKIFKPTPVQLTLLIVWTVFHLYLFIDSWHIRTHQEKWFWPFNPTPGIYDLTELIVYLPAEYLLIVVLCNAAFSGARRTKSSSQPPLQKDQSI